MENLVSGLLCLKKLGYSACLPFFCSAFDAPVSEEEKESWKASEDEDWKLRVTIESCRAASHQLGCGKFSFGGTKYMKSFPEIQKAFSDKVFNSNWNTAAAMWIFFHILYFSSSDVICRIVQKSPRMNNQGYLLLALGLLKSNYSKTPSKVWDLF